MDPVDLLYLKVLVNLGTLRDRVVLVAQVALADLEDWVDLDHLQVQVAQLFLDKENQLLQLVLENLVNLVVKADQVGLEDLEVLVGQGVLVALGVLESQENRGNPVNPAALADL